MLWRITLIKYTASETGSTFSVALNASEQIRSSLHNFQQEEERKNIFLLKARSVTQESINITVFYPLNRLLSLQFQVFVKEKSDRLFQFTVSSWFLLIVDLLESCYFGV